MTTTRIDLAAVLAAAEELDASDPATASRSVAIRLPDIEVPGAEDSGDILFLELLAAEYHPAKPQDRIEHPWLGPAALDAAAEELISVSPELRGRHNRYRPVPGEDAIRTGDLLDFLEFYGHEYQIVVFRAADVRTGTRLDVAALTAAGSAPGASVIWDWTGAVDWFPAPPSERVAAVFWSAHHSLLDGRPIAAGYWRPADGPAPELLTAPRPTPSDMERSGRLAAFAGEALADFGTLPAMAATDQRLPVLVIEPDEDPTAFADLLASGPGFQTVIRYGHRVVALPDPGADYAAIAAIALRLHQREGR
jgi:hypothetical protein